LATDSEECRRVALEVATFLACHRLWHVEGSCVANGGRWGGKERRREGRKEEGAGVSF